MSFTNLCSCALIKDHKMRQIINNFYLLFLRIMNLASFILRKNIWIWDCTPSSPPLLKGCWRSDRHHRTIINSFSTNGASSGNAMYEASGMGTQGIRYDISSSGLEWWPACRSPWHGHLRHQVRQIVIRMKPLAPGIPGRVTDEHRWTLIIHGWPRFSPGITGWAPGNSWKSQGWGPD